MVSQKESVIAAIKGREREVFESLGVQFSGAGRGNEISFHCPLPGHSNSDQTPSASFNTEKVVWCCQTCGGKGDVFSMAGHLHNLPTFPDQLKKVAEVCGVELGSQNSAGQSPETPPPWKRPFTATYDYLDEQKKFLSQAIRFSDGLKPRFMQRRINGKGGWIWNLDGVRRVLYRLPEIQGKETVYIVEGEKDVGFLWERGIPASCNAMGCGKWREEYTEQLKSAGAEKVVIIPDNDEPGKKHAIEVAASCFKAGLHTNIVHLPGLEKGGDISDWLDAGNTKERLLKIVEDSPILLVEPKPEQNRGSKPRDGIEIQWPDNPLDLFARFEPPEIRPEWLPGSIVDYVFDQASLMGTDPAIIALATLISCAGCIHDDFTVQPKRHDPTWTESARLWGAIVGDPSVKKTPAISKVTSPLRKMDMELAKEAVTKVNNYKLALKAYEKEMKNYLKKTETGEDTKPPDDPLRSQKGADMKIIAKNENNIKRAKAKKLGHPKNPNLLK